MKPTYRIRDWAKHFEKAQMRAVETVKWLAVPVKHDGLGFRRLMSRPDGLALFGAWNLIAQLAAKCRRDGALVTDLGPLDATDMALLTGAPADELQKALDVFSSPEIAWMERVEGDYQPTISELSPTGQDITEQDKTTPDGVGRRQAKGSVRKPAKFDATTIDLPAPFDTDEGREAWADWCLARREKGAAHTPTSAKLSLKELAKWPPDVALEAVRMAARNGWQGVFPERVGQAGSAPQKGQAKPSNEVSAAFDEAKRVILSVPSQDTERYRAAMATLPPRTRAALQGGLARRIADATDANRGIVFAAFRTAYEAAGKHPTGTPPPPDDVRRMVAGTLQDATERKERRA